MSLLPTRDSNRGSASEPLSAFFRKLNNGPPTPTIKRAPATPELDEVADLTSKPTVGNRKLVRFQLD